MFGWLKNLFAAPVCPGCGRELVEWTRERVSDGYREEMLWRGCPAYRDHANFLDGEHDRHYARWTRGKRVPLRPGQP